MKIFNQKRYYTLRSFSIFPRGYVIDERSQLWKVREIVIFTFFSENLFSFAPKIWNLITELVNNLAT